MRAMAVAEVGPSVLGNANYEVEMKRFALSLVLCLFCAAPAADAGLFRRCDGSPRTPVRTACKVACRVAVNARPILAAARVAHVVVRHQPVRRAVGRLLSCPCGAGCACR